MNYGIDPEINVLVYNYVFESEKLLRSPPIDLLQGCIYLFSATPNNLF
jgi:hypothetical protein